MLTPAVKSNCLSIGEEELRELLARVGTVDSVSVMREIDTGRSRGFAFMEMARDEEARKAIVELNSYPLGGLNLKVNEARAKTERRSKDFGGRGKHRRSEPRW